MRAALALEVGIGNARLTSAVDQL